MKLKLIYRDLKENRTNVSIEYFKGKITTSKGTTKLVREYENLKLYLYTVPSNINEEQHNIQVMQEANFILTKREEDYYIQKLEQIIKESEQVLTVKLNKRPNYDRIKAIVSRHKEKYTPEDIEAFNTLVVVLRKKNKSLKTLKGSISQLAGVPGEGIVKKREYQNQFNTELEFIKENTLFLLNRLKELDFSKRNAMFEELTIILSQVVKNL